QVIADKGISNYTDIARSTPGFNLQNQTIRRNDRTYTSMQTRGIAGGTTVFIDGIAVAAGTSGGINDIAQIEIINGPQSATFGRASFGGAINFITARPSHVFGASVEISAAT